MKAIQAAITSFILLQAFSSVAHGAYKVYEPCSRKEVLRNREDVPRIKALYSCHQADKITVKAIDPLSKVDKSDFDANKTKEALFCVALLNEHRQGGELFFSGQLTYAQGSEEKSKDISASAQFKPVGNRQYRMVHTLGAGEYRPTKNSIRIFQEKDIGNTVDVRVDQKTQTADLVVIESNRNRKTEMSLNCQVM